MIGTKLYDAGYRDLVSVAPPGAELSAGTSLRADDLGKIPAVKGANGWHGYPWMTSQPTREQVQTYDSWGANIGLRGTSFPGLDIDSSSPKLVALVEQIAREHLGPAPRRVGRPPRSLLVYRSNEPLSRVALEIGEGEERHLVEFLGHGRQYLVYGQHPTAGAYEWTTTPLWDLPASKLSLVSAEAVDKFFGALATLLTEKGVPCHRVGTGAVVEDGTFPEQEELLAPSPEALRDVVDSIPNDAAFADRDDYIKMGHAIKGACGDDESMGIELFLSWAARWTEGENDPETVRADWRRMHPPFRLGWKWLAARAARTTVAVHEFSAVPDWRDMADRPVGSSPHGPNLYTDDWIAEQILPDVRSQMRYDYPNGRWHVWDGVAWKEDSGGASGESVLFALRRLAERLIARAATVSETDAKAIHKVVARLGEYPTQSRVTSMLEMREGVRCDVDTFDQNVMELNTPGGIVDLTTGEIRPCDPDAMHSRATTATPAPSADAPIWLKFIEEVTNGDDELARYLQKMAGYCLTGTVREHTLTFVWGPGGNGKSVWLNTLSAIMGSYSTPAPLTAFFRGAGDQHPTDLAGLMGARLVTAPETQAGRVWDDQKIKAVTSGDPIRARFMRQDYVEFQPRFKLIVVGNHAPQVEQVDDAMKRRLNIVPFTFKPKVPDVDLMQKLEAEYPAILRWAIDGCLMWGREGLTAPKAVRDRTAAYFEEEDMIRQWMKECCKLDVDAQVSRAELYDSWKMWATDRGEHPGSLRMFRGELAPVLEELPVADRKVGDRDSRVAGYHGIDLKNRSFT